MKPLHVATRQFVAGVAVALACLATAQADDGEGTWRLVKRKLSDGTFQTPPTVYGMSTSKNGVVQLIVYWRTPEGKPASLSQISRWEWSENAVAATSVLLIVDDGSGKPPAYIVGGDRKSVSIIREAGRASYQHPLNAPYIVREGDKSIATLEGVFTDEWERVK